MERYGRSFSSSSTSSLMGGGLISWTPRIYSCSFCKREFKSAQALGGHMNVHRRDRARLRQSPPWDPPICNPNLNPNPNTNPSPNSNHVPNLNFSPPPYTTTEVAKPSPVTYTFPSLLSPRTRFTAVTDNVASTVTASPACVHLRRDELKSTRAVKALFGVRKLDRFIGEDDEAVGRDLEGGLDLELRLGYT